MPGKLRSCIGNILTGDANGTKARKPSMGEVSPIASSEGPAAIIAFAVLATSDPESCPAERPTGAGWPLLHQVGPALSVGRKPRRLIPERASA